MTEYIFIINLSWEINVNTNHCNFGQPLANLIGIIPIIAFFLGRREYYLLYYGS